PREAPAAQRRGSGDAGLRERDARSVLARSPRPRSALRRRSHARRSRRDRREPGRAAAGGAVMRWLLVLVLVLAQAGCGGCGEWDLDLERMLEQPRFTSYEACDVCKQGSIMMMPPAGT